MSDSGTRTASSNSALLEAFRHNSWATQQLLTRCRQLPAEQLRSATTRTYGDILVTFNHLVLAEGHYLRQLAGTAPAWLEHGDSADLAQLQAWVEDLEQRWERLLSDPVDAEQVLVVDNGAYAVRGGVIVAQALHHGNAHREQICAILTSLGIDPPDIQPWAYARAVGRLWARTQAADG